MSGACPVFGFDVELIPAVGADAKDIEAVRREFQALVVDEAGLEIVGEPGDGGRFTLTRTGSQATEMDRDQVAAWGDRQLGVVTVVLGPLVDLGRARAGGAG